MMVLMGKTVKKALLFTAIAFLAGCGRGDKAYFSGELLIKPGEVTFTDWANHMTLTVAEESAGSFSALTGLLADSAGVSRWVEFYGELDTIPQGVQAGQKRTVHIEKLISHDGSNKLSSEVSIAGIYESEIEGKKQQLILYPNYTYMWTIFPERNYELITHGEWERRGPLVIQLTPFEDQEQFRQPREDYSMIDMGTVHINGDGAVSIVPDSVGEANRADSSSVEKEQLPENERMKESLEADRKVLQERKKTPPPGEAAFEFDVDSQSLVEIGESMLVFWKIYI